MKMLVCFVLSLAAGVAAADGEWPLLTLRHNRGVNDCPDVMAKLVEIQRRHSGCCDEVWLETGGRTNVAETRRRAEQCASFRALYKEAGIGFGFQQGCTFGHSSDFGSDNPTAQHFETDVWQRDWRGCKIGHLCPRAPEVLEFEYESTKVVLETMRPVSYWLDDDLRLAHCRTRGCFCDRCVAAFNAAFGHDLTREALVARLDGEALHDPLRAEWRRFSADSLACYGAAAARAADEVLPDCRVAYQSVRGTVLDNGPDFRPLLKALTGTRRTSTGIRPGDGVYTEAMPRQFVEKALLVAREAERCRTYGGLVGTVCYEQETYPRHVLHKSPDAIVTESLLAMASGCDTLSHYWFMQEEPEPLEDFERFCTAMAAVRPMFERLSANARRTHLAGVARFVGRAAAELRKADVADRHDLALALTGVPVTVYEAGLRPWYVNEHSLDELGPGDVARLETAPVVFTEGAWERFRRDCPDAAAHDGGKWAHVPEPDPFERCSVRKAWLDALDEVTGGAFPVRVNLNHPLRILPRVDGEGRLVQLSVLNCSIGDTGPFEIELRQDGAKRTEKVANLAGWKMMTLFL